jgi:hypothetical protein
MINLLRGKQQKRERHSWQSPAPAPEKGLFKGWHQTA